MFQIKDKLEMCFGGGSSAPPPPPPQPPPQLAKTPEAATIKKTTADNLAQSGVDIPAAGSSTKLGKKTLLGK
jgi:hypothetical protein